MISHHIGHFFHTEFLRRLYRQRHLIVEIITHGVIQVLIHTRGKTVEIGPYPCFAIAQSSKIGRRVHIAKTEFFVFARKDALLAGVADDIPAVETMFGIVKINLGYSRLIGVSADMSVGNAFGHPNGSFVQILSLFVVTGSFGHDFHYPGLVGIGNGKRFSGRRVAVFLHQLINDGNGLAGGFGPLQSHKHQGAVIHNGCRIRKFRPASESGFANH